MQETMLVIGMVAIIICMSIMVFGFCVYCKKHPPHIVIKTALPKVDSVATTPEGKTVFATADLHDTA